MTSVSVATRALGLTCIVFVVACSDDGFGSFRTKGGYVGSVGTHVPSEDPSALRPATPTVGSGTPLASTDLVTGAFPMGITTDGYLVFGRYDDPTTETGPYSLEVLPIAGGDSVVLARNLEYGKTSVAVSGAVVGWWTGVPNGDRLALGRLSYWSLASGVKADVAMVSPARVLEGSADGTHVFFARDATTTTASFVYTTTSVSDAAPLLTDAMLPPESDVGACTIGTAIGSENDLVLAYCRVGNAELEQARLARITAGGTVSLEAETGFSARVVLDPSGTNAFVRKYGSYDGFVVPMAGGPLAAVGPAQDFVFSKDGASAVFQSGAALKRIDFGGAATPTTLMTGDMMAIDVDATFSNVLVLSEWSTSQPFIAVVDTNIANQAPVALAVESNPIRFTASGGYVFYTDKEGSLASKPTAGGPPWVLVRRLQKSANVVPVTEGDSIVVRAGSANVPDLWYANAATGASGRFAVGSATGPQDVFARGKRVFYPEAVKGTFMLRSVELP